MTAAHEQFYSQAQYYEIAFSYRDVVAEADFMEACFERYTGRRPESVLELACGPGYHTIEFAKRGRRAVGLDLRPEMVEHMQRKAEGFGLQVEPKVADMRHFQLGRPVDLALNLLTSFGYLLTNEDIVAHLRTVARNLAEDGLYLIEANHPRDFFNGIQFRPCHWSIEREGTVVDATWGADGTHVDLANEIYDMQASYHVRNNGHEVTISDQAPLRLVMPQELRALVALSNVFNPVGWYGDFDLAQPFDDSDRSWRMIAILKKKPVRATMRARSAARVLAGAAS